MSFCLSVNQMQSAACHFRRIHTACSCSKLITPITCQQRLPGLLARVSRGVLAPDCVTTFHFLLLYARRNKCSCCRQSSRKALQISHCQSSRINFYYWPVQQPHVTVAFSHKDKDLKMLSHKRTGARFMLDNNFADLTKNE